MTHYRLLSFGTSSWAQRVAIVLREKQVEFEQVQLDPANRPAWFAEVSPHGKVPVLQLEDGTALFESAAITEYLDETVEPRLHPADPVARAFNRAWTDYVPSFSAAVSALFLAPDETGHAEARAALAKAFARLETALSRQGDGPYFNGETYALVDAGYAPFLHRYLLIEEFSGDRLIADFPRLERWAKALSARPSTHSFPPEEFRKLFLDFVKGRGGHIAKTLAA